MEFNQVLVSDHSSKCENLSFFSIPGPQHLLLELVPLFPHKTIPHLKNLDGDRDYLHPQRGEPTLPVLQLDMTGSFNSHMTTCNSDSKHVIDTLGQCPCIGHRWSEQYHSSVMQPSGAAEIAILASVSSVSAVDSSQTLALCAPPLKSSVDSATGCIASNLYCGFPRNKTRSHLKKIFFSFQFFI